MNNALLIEGDKEGTVKSIAQWLTYDGLLEGLPTKKMNKQILEMAMEKAQVFCRFDNIYLIEPQQTPLPYEGRYPFGEPAALPAVTCIAIIEYIFPFRDQSKDFSSLCVIWFQDDYAFPINTQILEKIKNIPFSKLCGEFTY